MGGLQVLYKPPKKSVYKICITAPSLKIEMKLRRLTLPELRVTQIILAPNNIIFHYKFHGASLLSHACQPKQTCTSCSRILKLQGDSLAGNA